MSFPADLEPLADLWIAALQLLIEDAYKAAHRGHRAGPEAIEALNDVLTCGPMTSRLCRPIGLDPATVRDGVRSKLDLPKAA